MSQGSEDTWLPKTKADWAEMFADGIALDRTRREEADAKAKAEGKKNEGSGENDTGPKRTLAEWILGGITG